MSQHQIKVNKKEQYSQEVDIIIPAAGIGSRLMSWGPKPLIAFRNQRSILDYHIYNINRVFKKANVILVGGFKATYLFSKTPDSWIKIENERYETTNVVRSLCIGLRAARTQRIIIIYGDLVYNYYALIPIIGKQSAIVTTDKSMKDREVGCIIHDGRINQLSYDIRPKWAQILTITGRELELLRKFCYDEGNYNKFGFEALNYVINQGGQIKAVSDSRAIVFDIDSPKDIRDANEGGLP